MSWRALRFPGFETTDFVRIACPDVTQLYLNYPYLKNLNSKKKSLQLSKECVSLGGGALPYIDPRISYNLAV